MKISFIEFTCSQIEPYQLSHISNSIQYPNEEKNKIKQKNRFNSFSQMNIFVFFSFLVALYPSLLLLLLLMFIIYEYIYIYIYRCFFFFFSFPSLVCVCTFFFFFFSSCDYFSPLYVVYCMCISIEKQTTNNTNRVLPYYLCTDFLFSLLLLLLLLSYIYS